MLWVLSVVALASTPEQCAERAEEHFARIVRKVEEEGPLARYKRAEQRCLEEIGARWPHALRTNVEHMRWEEDEGDHPASLTLRRSAGGDILYLREERAQSACELWTQRKDFRLEERTMQGTAFTWMTATETLRGMRGDNLEASSLRVDGKGSIDPCARPEEIAQWLRTPHRVALFQRVFPTYDAPESIEAFFARFRMGIAQWRELRYRGGACNTYAEVAAETLAQHGYPMHVLTFAPQRLIVVEPWHVAAGYPQGKEAWVIIDGTLRNFIVVGSPEEYAQQIGMQLSPVNGVMRWRREPDPHRRFLQHLTLPTSLATESIGNRVLDIRKQ